MIILRPHETKVLAPVREREWREPSLFVPKDQFGNPISQTRFFIRGSKILDDGFRLPKFTLWFDSRDDWDQFIWSLGHFIADGIPVPREDWHLPTEIWGDPTLYLDLDYLIAAPRFLSGTSGSNQTDSSIASDWNPNNNLIEVVASGASGGVRRNTNGSGGNAHGTGGGAGAYSSTPNVSLTPGGSATYRLSAGGVGVATVAAGSINGNDGADAWYNGTTLAGSSVGAKGGVHGVGASTSDQFGGLGGDAAGGIGTTKKSGGRGGNTGANAGGKATGGGGAGGPSADGTQGGDIVTGTDTDGGAGGGPNGGAGGLSGGTNPGGNGTTFDASHGTGGGSGGWGVQTSTGAGTATSGDGGNYGGASGGVGTRGASGTTANAVSGTAGQALIVLTYTPAVAAAFLQKSFQHMMMR